MIEMPSLGKRSVQSQLGHLDRSSCDDVAAGASTAGSVASKLKQSVRPSILHESITSERQIVAGTRTEMPPITAG